MSVKKNAITPQNSALTQLGDDLRGLRKAQGLTLEDLAATSGKSVSFISKIERGQAKPSVTTLQELAGALGVPVGWFFETDGPAPADERPYIVRANRRRKLSYSGLTSTDYMGFEDHLLSASLDGQLALGISTYQPGGNTGDELYTHTGEEAGLILKGQIDLHIEDKVFRLEAGDSFSFAASLPHRYSNPGDSKAQIVWANTPVNLRR
ncbi:helix-turn-helix domain-containing protein [Roseovarius aestuarii]|uniref:HTH-type transcriptional regulator PuuR n=1 Tax=Roseovarius aestuarii TaxID=475083 RepID=A0A1X7BQC8_9RHOB|nr:helix-turn-helix domain-containing protein [Roseovarius aestuarii]SMC11773.1 HTH-type transcriptional regulator PuuR [Roseovarius aestuarii]